MQTPLIKNDSPFQSRKARPAQIEGQVHTRQCQKAYAKGISQDLRGRFQLGAGALEITDRRFPVSLSPSPGPLEPSWLTPPKTFGVGEYLSYVLLLPVYYCRIVRSHG